MAQARINRKMGIVGVELPECPVCFETMSAPIYNCGSGHSLCAGCTANMCPNICPLCRAPMTTMRNRALEDIISTAKVPCPNKPNGCKYSIATQDMENHLKECIFREMACPLAVFGKCSWNGKIKELLDHFKAHHPQNCNINTNSDIELINVSIFSDDRHVYLVSQDKMLFILTVKIDSIVQKMAYWIVQLIGSKKVAQQYVYEIHVTSKQDSRRNVTFHEYCFNDAMKPDEIFRQGKCGIVPLGMLSHFIKDKKLSFRFSIHRICVNPNKNFEKVDTNRSPSAGLSGVGPQGGGPRGPRPHGPRPQGPRPQGHRHKSPGPNNIRHKDPNPHSGPRGQFKNNHPFNFKTE